MKFSILKKTRDLKDVWLVRASFLRKKLGRVLFGSPLDAASGRSRRAQKGIFDLSVSYFSLGKK